MNATPTRCLSDEDLVRVLRSEFSASPAEQDRVAAHLEACAACRGRLEQRAGGARFIGLGPSSGHGDSEVLKRLVEDLRALPVSRAADRAEGDGVPDADAGILLPPEREGCLGRFGGYDILERVAAGGMGIVFKAHDAALNRVVALKVLAPALAASEVARSRFLREARAAAAVVHEHVVAIHAVGEERGLPYLVMQWVQGLSLDHRLAAGGPLALREILRIGLQTALGLSAAHAQGLVHRDVKPANILLENSIERVRLTDFGLARAADDPRMTRAGTLAGTPEFMAPEQARGEPARETSDLYSPVLRTLPMRSGGRGRAIPFGSPAPIRWRVIRWTWGKWIWRFTRRRGRGRCW